MKRMLFLACTICCIAPFQLQANNNVKQFSVDVNLIEVSQELLLAAKTKERTDSFTTILQGISPDVLEKQLATDLQKKAFWINIYNSYTQIILSVHPKQYKNRSSFFGSRQIMIAGQQLSLDDIEHGIIRHSAIKWSLGWLHKLFPSSFEKKNRVSKIDYRIHFALNCGAKSCPPIAFYKPEQLDKQLDMATSVYLKGESEYNDKKNSVCVPALMGWFRRDFGGKKNMKKLLTELGIVPAGTNPAVQFKKYDWNLFLENYKNE
jgi:Protein of unknown function, DUF547